MKFLDQNKELIVGLGLKESRFETLKKYVQLLWNSNIELNLFSRKMTFEELILNHVVDCTLPLSLFPKNIKSVADFGSGGGLPAVLFAIQFPEIQFSVYEKSPKKQNYLKEYAKLAPNIKVFGDIPLKLEGIDLVTARAFKPIDVILDMSRNYYQDQGRYFLLKGRREKIDEELLLASKKFKNIPYQIEKLHSPVLEVERHIVMIN